MMSRLLAWSDSGTMRLGETGTVNGGRRSFLGTEIIAGLRLLGNIYYFCIFLSDYIVWLEF